MRRDLALALVAGFGMILFVPSGFAQDDGGLVEHVEGHAAEAQRDPSAFAANATTPGWQRGEFNFTVGWTCETSARTPARDALEELGACDRLRDVAAVEDEEEDEENETRAETEELDEDDAAAKAEALAEEGARAVDEGVRAVAELLDDAAGDPLNVLAHVESFLRRALDIVRDLLGGLLGLAVAVPFAMLDALRTVAEALIGVALGIADGLRTMGSLALRGADALGHLVAAVGAGIAAAGSAVTSGVGAAVGRVTDAVSAAVDGTVDAIGSLLDRIGGGANEPGPAVEPSDAVDDAGDAATGLVDGLVRVLPV